MKNSSLIYKFIMFVKGFFYFFMGFIWIIVIIGNIAQGTFDFGKILLLAFVTAFMIIGFYFVYREVDDFVDNIRNVDGKIIIHQFNGKTSEFDESEFEAIRTDRSNYSTVLLLCGSQYFRTLTWWNLNPGSRKVIKKFEKEQ